MLKNLPKNLFYNILSYIPYNGVTEKLLRLQKKKIKIYNFISENLSIDKDDLKNIRGQIFSFNRFAPIYFYEDQYLYITIDIKNFSYICIYY